MSNTTTPAALTATLQTTNDRLETLRATRLRLSAQVEEVAIEEAEILEKVKTGAAMVDDLSEALRKKENVRRVLTEIESEIETLLAENGRTQSDLHRALKLETLHVLAKQAQEKRGEFLAAKHAACQSLAVSLASMREAARELGEVRTSFSHEGAALIDAALPFYARQNAAQAVLQELASAGVPLDGICDPSWFLPFVPLWVSESRIAPKDNEFHPLESYVALALGETKAPTL
jgi:DNA repair exonuclease SbcCD ATPase subunit